MAAIVCYGCGNVFDSHAMACPRCNRCPECGTKHRERTEACRSCGHPADALALAELEQRLDPALPRNEKAIRWLDDDWESEQIWGRVYFWRLFALVPPLVLILHFIALGFRVVTGLGTGWMNFLVLTPFMVLVFWCLPRLLRRGWFPWLLREQR